MFRDLYVNGNELQSQGLTDLIHILVQQAVKDDAERQDEERVRATEAFQAAQLGQCNLLVSKMCHSSPSRLFIFLLLLCLRWA